MKTNLVLALGIGSALLLTSCKSQESAYRQAYLNALEQQQQSVGTTTVTVPQTTTTPVTTTTTTPVPTTTTTPVTTTTTTPVASTTTVDTSETRTINGGMTVINGQPLKMFSVVVGSFVTSTNAETLCENLQRQGYDARIIKTNEVINGQTPWYRVIASSYDDKQSAVNSRNTLRSKYASAWLLYNK